MGMPGLTQKALVEALGAVGVHEGDGLLVHSALQLLGKPEGGLEMYGAALRECSGPEGTIAAPAFSFAFARGKDYDPENTPSEGMGAFSEWLRQHPDALRTSHPMQSLSVLGARAEDLANRDTASAFDDGSAFERMLELDFKLLLLGADVQAASIVHYSEQRAEVPYRYWKEFSGKVRVGSNWEMRSYRMFVRDLELDPKLRLTPIREALEAKGQWAEQRLNYGRIALCSQRDFVAATDELLAADPWALVKQPERLRVSKSQ